MTGDWQDANNDYLAAALHWLRLVLRRHAEGGSHAQGASHAEGGGPARPALVYVGRRAGKNLALPAGPGRDLAVTDGQVTGAQQAWATAAAGEQAPAMVELSDRLGLSPFEQKILLLCAAMELDPAAPGLCALAQHDEGKPWPTFALAFELFDDPSWEALSPRGPLRDWRLVEITQLVGQPLTGSALRADERIVSYIKGLKPSRCQRTACPPHSGSPPRRCSRAGPDRRS